MKLLQNFDTTTRDYSGYDYVSTGAIIINTQGKIVMQRRTDDAPRAPGMISTFGGALEAGEDMMDSLIRELQEELGATMNPADTKFIGVATEEMQNRGDIKSRSGYYVWHDTQGSITHCTEGKIIEFDTVDDLLAQPDIMPDVRIAILDAVEIGLLA